MRLRKQEGKLPEESLVRAVESGMTQSEIARIFGCTRQYVHQRCEAQGLTTKRRVAIHAQSRHAVCARCGKPFEPVGKRRYCSEICRKRPAPDTNSPTKVCSMCKRPKNRVTDFYDMRSSADGKHHRCIECHSKYQETRNNAPTRRKKRWQGCTV